MMDWTDRHCRAFHRCLSKRALLWTEMVTADAVIHGDRQRLIGFHEAEHPVVLQLGGSEPHKLAEAARIAEDFGYDFGGLCVHVARLVGGSFNLPNTRRCLNERFGHGG